MKQIPTRSLKEGLINVENSREEIGKARVKNILGLCSILVIIELGEF
jgi:hypothetical protein